MKQSWFKINKRTPLKGDKSIFNPRIPNKVKSVSPVRLSQYNSRSKKEWNIIDNKPLGDKDRDGVMNWFDCKPLNRKKDVSKILKAEIKKRFLETNKRNILSKKKFLGNIKAGNLREMKRANRGHYAYIVPTNLNKPSKLNNEFLEKIKRDQTTNAYGTAEEKRKRVTELKGPFKVISEKEIIHHIGKNPELLQELEGGTKIKLASPTTQRDIYSSIEYERTGGSFESGDKKWKNKIVPKQLAASTAGVYNGATGDIELSRIHFKEKPLLDTIRHEIKHHIQDREGYLLSKNREDIEKEAVHFAKEETEREKATREYKEEGDKAEALKALDNEIEDELLLSDEDDGEDFYDDELDDNDKEGTK